MKVKRTFLNALAGAVLASGALGAHVFAAGEERTIPEGGGPAMATEPNSEKADWVGRFEARLAELRARGEPVTMEEMMARRPKIPDGENSALVFLRAFEAQKQVPGDALQFVDLLDLLGGFPPELGVRHADAVLEAIRAYLAARAEVLSIIHEGAKLPSGVYPVTIDPCPYATLLPHLSPLRHAARLCALEATCSAQRGDGAAAVESLFAIGRLSSSVGGCPFLIEALVRIAVERILSDTLEKSLALCEMPPNKLELLSREIGIEQRELSLVEAMRMERANGYWLFTRPSEEVMAFLQSEAQRFAPQALERDQKARDALCYYDHMDEAVRVSALPDRDQLREAGSLKRKTEEIPEDCVLSRLMLPALSRAFRVQVIARTSLKVARAALAVEQWRMKNGRWPERLEDVVPAYLDEAPHDPFSDGTIGYVRTEAGGVILYSVGPDGKYNGGRSREEAMAAGEPEAYDLAFRLLAVKDRGARQATARDWQAPGGRTLLHVASQAGARTAVEQLLAEGADVSVRDADGRTALHYAAEQGHTEVVRLFIEKGADVNAEDHHRRSPLHLAAQEGHREAAEALLKAGAEVNALDGMGWTPTCVANKRGHKDLAAFLAEHGGVE